MENSGNAASVEATDNQWIPQLAHFLAGTEEAEAVRWGAGSEELTVATLGRIDESVLRAKLRETLASAFPEAAGNALPPGVRLRHLPEDEVLLEKAHGCDVHAKLWTWRKIPWPTPEEAAGLEEEPEDWRVLAVLSGLCGVLGISGFAVQASGYGPVWLGPALYILSMVAGGWDAARDAGPNVLKGKLDIHFLMLAVAVGASIIGAFGEGALLLFLFSFAGALEHFALHRTRREIHALFKLAPKTAMIRDPETGLERSVEVEAIVSGQTVVLRPGDTVPVDGRVLSGESACDESSLTGEAHPVAKGPGDEVYSGTANLWGALDIRCVRPAGQSSLSRIIQLIQQARHLRAPSQRFTDKFGPRYTVGVLVATFVMFLIWWLGFGIAPFYNVEVDDTVQFSAFYRAMTLLVVASPCALVLSIPSAILAAIAWGARHGILFRGGAAIEQLAATTVVALDKTGTLTTGDLQVAGIESFPPGREGAVLERAYALEERASHPIARAIVGHAIREGAPLTPVSGFRSIAGHGVEGEVGGALCVLGRRELMQKGPLADWAKNLPVSRRGFSEVWLVSEDVLGRILLQDTLRERSGEVLAALKNAGVRTVMLTGDRIEAAESIAAGIGLSEVRAGLTPEGKVDAVTALTRAGERVAMVGDGINDAPCLAAADVAVAMGARGSDAALEQSDVVLMNDRIENFWEAFRLSQRARRIIRQNVTISLGTIVVMVGAAIFGVVPITLGVLAHEGSTVLVCLNSMRLLGGGRVKR